MTRTNEVHNRKEDKFRHRGKELFRIEALSDAVFAFSVSLLVASLEVPQTFAELKIITRGAIPFFLTVSLVFLFWYQQYTFFRRYGLNDLKTILLNLAYLAVVIFYVYPLKFLFSLLISAWSDIELFAAANEKGLVVLATKDFPQLIILFSVGYFLIWFIIYLLHQHVLRSSKQFAFTPFEKLLTEKEVRGALWNALVGLLAAVFAVLNWETLAGICYLFIPVILILNQYIFKRRTPLTP
jgi:uncharacterized membrane protein